MKRYTYLIIITLLYIARASAQDTKADSLLARFEEGHALKEANELFQFFQEEELTDSLIQMTERTPEDTVCQQVWYWAAEYYNMRQQYKKASDYGLKALPLCEASDNVAVESDCLTVLAISLFRQGDFTRAIEYAKRCNEIDRKTGNAANIASSLNLLTAIFMGAYQHEEAERCIIEGLKFAEKDGDENRLAILNGMACEVYFYQKDYERALSYGNKALEIEQKLGHTMKVAVRQSQIAGALIGLKRNDEARQLLTEALPLLKDGNQHSYAIACNQMGDILLAADKQQEATAYYTIALEVLTTQNDIYNEVHSRHGLYMSLRNTNPMLAMEHNDRYNQLRDSIYSLRTSALLSQYATLVGVQRLQAEKEELRQRHRQNILIGVAAGLVLLAVVWLIARNLIRREQRRIAELTRQIAQLTEQSQDDAVAQAVQTDRNATESNGVTAESVNRQQFLRRLIEVVNEGLSQGVLNVEHVAAEMNMSTPTLRRHIIQTTGESPKSYFTAIQMQKAISLLTNSSKPVAEIGRQCGFQETTSFIRAFKRIYGVSPSQYAKREPLQTISATADETA